MSEAKRLAAAYMPYKVLACQVFQGIDMPAMLVLLNLPLIGLWVRLLKVPYRLLYPAILLFC